MCCRNATSILGQFTLLDYHLRQQHKLLWYSTLRLGQPNSLAKAQQPGPDLQQLHRSHSPVVGPVTCLSSVAEAVLDRQSADWQPALNLAAAITTTAVGAEQLFGFFAIYRLACSATGAGCAANRLTGSIPPGLSSLSQLQQLRLPDNNLTGTLPAAWGEPDAFPGGLQVLQVSRNALTGTLCGSWADENAFQEILYLELQDTHMAGSLPESWSLPGAFPNLRELTISASGLNGTIPAGWGSLRAFQNLEILAITDARLAGSVPAFNNAVLNTLILTSLGLRSGLEDFWNSTAPLALVDLANNSINGQVPDVPQALRSVIGLDVSQNSLQGTVPLSWLQPGNFLSHVSYLNLGQAWDNSVLQNNWRQTLCLHEDLYRADVTGQQLALLPKLVTRLAGQDAEIAGTDTLAWVQEGLSETAAFALVYTFEQGTNQLSSVSTICANPSATRVLLIVWLVFAGCCLAMLALYVCWQRWLIKQSGSLKRFLPVFAALQTMYSMFSGLGGFAFFCYDLVSNIVVLAQVWSKWPASVLLAIFLFHFAMTGAIVAFHGFYRLVGQKYDLSATGARFVTCAMIVSLLGSPFMIPVFLLLDTCAFIRQV